MALSGDLTVNFTGGAGTFVPTFGQVFVIVNNDKSDVVSGSFSGLASGSTVTVDGKNLKIYYAYDGGGDGNLNDVVLVAAAGTPGVLYVNNEFGNVAKAVDGDAEFAGTQSATVTVDAFDSVTGALAAFSGYAGNLILNGGTYASALLSGGGNVTLQLVSDGINAQPGITIQDLSGDAGDAIVTQFHATSGNGDLTVEQGSFAGVISGAGSLTKTTGGTLTLSGTAANTFTGPATVNAGTLVLNKTAGVNAIVGAAGTGSNDLVIGDGAGTDTVQLSAADQIADTVETVMTAGGTPIFNLNGNNETIGSLASTNAAASVALGGGTLTTGNALNTDFAGVISGTGGLVKQGAGNFTLSGSSANTFTGSTRVNAGTLILNKTAGVNALVGTAGTGSNDLVIGDGAGTDTVQLSAADQIADTVEVVMAAGGTPVFNLNGNNETIGSLASTNSSASVTVGAGSLTAGGLGATTTYAGLITGTGGFTLTGGDLTLTLRATSPFLPTNVSVNSGAKLTLSTGGFTGNAMTGSGVLTVAGTVVFNATHALGGDNAQMSETVTVNGGTLTMNREQYFNTLNLNGATINGANDVRAGNASNWVVGGTALSTISSGVTLNLNNANFVVNDAVVGSGADLIVSGVIGGDGGKSLVKTGLGTMVISGAGANTYDDATQISNGVLNIQKDTALGSTVGATTVANLAALQLQGGIAVGAEALTLNGTGITNDGAMRSMDGGNSFAGAITLNSNGRINSDAGLLTLSGNFSGAGKTLVVGGAGDTLVSGKIQTAGGGLTKDGAGTLTLSTTSNYTGNTDIQNGKVIVNGDISTSVLTTVQNGAYLGGTGSVGATTIALGGSISPGNFPGTINVVGAYNQLGNYNYEMTATGTHDLVNVTGTVTLGAASTLTGYYSNGAVFPPGLGAGGSFAPAAGTVFGVIQNDGVDAVVGTFGGGWANGNAGVTGATLAAGDAITIDGDTLRIYYNGNLSGVAGEFNDVVLVADGAAAPGSTLYVNDQWTVAGAVDGNQETTALEMAYAGISAYDTVASLLADQPAYTGQIILNGGTYANVDLITGAGIQLQLVGDTQAPGPTENDVTIASLTGSSSDSIVTNFSGGAGLGDLIVGGGSFAGVISGAGSLTKTAAGTMTLSGDNTYAGTTSVEDGTLQQVGNYTGGGELAVGDTIGANDTAIFRLQNVGGAPNYSKITVNGDDGWLDVQDGSISITNISIGAGGHLSIGDGDANAASVTVNGNFTNNGLIEMLGTDGTLTVIGNMTNNSGFDLLDGLGTIGGSFTNSGTGTVQVGDGDNLLGNLVVGTTLVNNGVFDVVGGDPSIDGQVDVGSSLTNNLTFNTSGDINVTTVLNNTATGIFTQTGGTVDATNLTNSGKFDVQGGTATFATTAVNAVGADLIVGDGTSPLDALMDVGTNFTNGGTVLVNGDGTLNVGLASTNNVGGTITVDGGTLTVRWS